MFQSPTWQEDGLLQMQNNLKTVEGLPYDIVVRKAEVFARQFKNDRKCDLKLLLEKVGFAIMKDAVEDIHMAAAVSHWLPIYARGAFEGKSSTILLFCYFVVSNIPTPL
jgi:hypothetical protein